MIGARELARLQADLAATLPETAAVLRATTSPDGLGGQTTTWGTVATVAARLAPAGGGAAERLLAGRLVDGALWAITLPAGTDVRLDDRLQLGGRVYAVVALLAPRSLEAARRVLAREVA